MEYFSLNRTLCSVLSDMRDICKYIKSPHMDTILSLIEEAQCMGNRMESALADQRDSKDLQEHVSKLRDEYRELFKKVENKKKGKKK